MGWLDETPNRETKVALLVALRDITDGKIFVEAERAKLTRLLAQVRALCGEHSHPPRLLSGRGNTWEALRSCLMARHSPGASSYKSPCPLPFAR